MFQKLIWFQRWKKYLPISNFSFFSKPFLHSYKGGLEPQAFLLVDSATTYASDSA
jgi:hypothetical protein